MSDVTPAEDQLPLMISVDDHVMEPRDLWQQQLPPSLRARGPRVVQEKVSLKFEGGHYGFERNSTTIWSPRPGSFMVRLVCPAKNNETLPRPMRIFVPERGTKRTA
jgi:hypothetical protein